MNGSSNRAEERWLLTGGVESPGAGRVFCFPHAGGNARSFLDWQPAIGDIAEIVPVCAPGRGRRSSEPGPADVQELAAGAAAAIAQRADRPFALFGHSLGALVAFEVARRLRGLPALRHLVASACAAPSLLPSERVRRASQLEGREFAEAVRFYGGIPDEVVADEELRRLLLPGLQADVRLLASYRYERAAPLGIAVSLINGRDDPHVRPADLQPWQSECAQPPREHWVGGGHFHLDDDPAPILDVLRESLRSEPGQDPDPGAYVEVI